MNLSPEELRRLSASAALTPKEQLQAVETDSDKIYFGVPKESSFQERRVALTPDAVGLLVSRGHRVMIESEAGLGSNFADNQFISAGGELTHDKKEVYQANILMKVAPPSMDEIKLMQDGQTLISALQLSTQPKAHLEALMKKHITAIAWDFIQGDDGVYPIVRSMGEIAGNTSILIAAELLCSGKNSRRAMFGGITGITPTEVVIIGAGTVGEYATRAALGLGATVQVFDQSMYKLRRLQNDVGVRLNTCILHPESLAAALKTCDVAIGAVRSNTGRSPCLVTEEMVMNMKQGSVIVDVSIDQGGCFETSEVTTLEHPICIKHDIVHYGVPNIPSRVSRTASKTLSNIFSPLLMNFGEHGSLANVLRNFKGVRNGVYLYKGTLTSEPLGDAFDIQHKNLNLLLGMF